MTVRPCQGSATTVSPAGISQIQPKNQTYIKFLKLPKNERAPVSRGVQRPLAPQGLSQSQPKNQTYIKFLKTS